MLGIALSFITGGFSKLLGFLRTLSPTTLIIGALALLNVILWMRGNHYAKQRDHAVAGLKIALDGIENVRKASHEAEAAQKANLTRVAEQQKAISERVSHDFEARIATARALADRLRREHADHSATSNAGMSATREDPASVAQAASAFGLSERLIATEQAIQLDELITWVEAQQNVNTGGNP
jgi:cysteinyl-tRNA synthetase